jgi:hypothetical protein
VSPPDPSASRSRPRSCWRLCAMPMALGDAARCFRDPQSVLGIDATVASDAMCGDGSLACWSIITPLIGACAVRVFITSLIDACAVRICWLE